MTSATKTQPRSRRLQRQPAESSSSSRQSRLFRTGGSLAIRIPNAWALGKVGDEVRLVRKGRKVVIELADEWPEEFLKCLGSCADLPPLERMPQVDISRTMGRLV